MSRSHADLCRKKALHQTWRRVEGSAFIRNLAPPGRKDQRKPSGSLGPEGLPAQQDTGAAIRQQRNNCPYYTIGRRSSLTIRRRARDRKRPNRHLHSGLAKP
jgi:hypothetical protein